MKCPFCGSEAEIYRDYTAFGRRSYVKVRCTKCRCNSGIWKRVDYAIKEWNRRVDPEGESNGDQKEIC